MPSKTGSRTMTREKQTQDYWTGERARKTEETLMESLEGIPGISHLQESSHAGIENYGVQFMFL